MGRKIKTMSKKITVTLPDSLFERLKKLGVSYESDSELIRCALEVLLSHYEIKKKK